MRATDGQRTGMELTVEIEGEGPQDELPAGGADLVAFMSFAVMRGFGAQHPYLDLVDRLHLDHDVRLGPLTTFYQGTVEDEEDAAKLELAWQDSAKLRASLEAMANGLAAHEPALDGLLRQVRGEGLAAQVDAVLVFARQAESRGKRVRLSYAL